MHCFTGEGALGQLIMVLLIHFLFSCRQMQQTNHVIYMCGRKRSTMVKVSIVQCMIPYHKLLTDA